MMLANMQISEIAVLGALAERWLFFAQAQHTVNLYYGADAV